MVCIENNVDRDLVRAPERTSSEDGNESLSASGLTPSQVWDAFDRIRESQALTGCRRLVQLLEFVVRSTLQGEAPHLKETTIGVAVFGRNPDYDPKADTIVRSQAWRLRSKLRKYYAAEGAGDPVIIDLPLGHYVPEFHAREQGFRH
jgi:hypothetical protein